MIRYLSLRHISISVLFGGLVLLMTGCSGDEPSRPAATESPRAERVAEHAPRAADIVEPESKDPPVQSTAARSPSRPGTDWRETFEGLDLDEIFHTVARKIRYEPYRGVLRGAAGTWQAASGNALDQSMLLAEILQHRGYRTRFVSGTLQGDNLAAVLRGLYPPVVPKPALGSEFAPYEPIEDPALLAAADHVWVEVYQPGTWLPLDPSFPRAQPGEAYAAAKSRYDEIPQSLFQTVTMTLWQELRDGSTSKLGSLEETVAALGLRPLSLIIHRIPKSARDDSKKSRGTTRVTPMGFERCSPSGSASRHWWRYRHRRRAGIAPVDPSRIPKALWPAGAPAGRRAGAGGLHRARVARVRGDCTGREPRPCAAKPLPRHAGRVKGAAGSASLRH